MNLNELYDTTAADEHGNIVVAGERVYVRTPGGTNEYALLPDGQMELVHADPKGQLDAIQQDLAAIKTALGI